MRCWQCGAQVRDGVKLCIYCGAVFANGPAGAPRQPSRAASGQRHPYDPSPRRTPVGEPGSAQPYRRSDDDSAEDSDPRSSAGNRLRDRPPRAHAADDARAYAASSNNIADGSPRHRPARPRIEPDARGRSRAESQHDNRQLPSQPLRPRAHAYPPARDAGYGRQSQADNDQRDPRFGGPSLPPLTMHRTASGYEPESGASQADASGFGQPGPRSQHGSRRTSGDHQRRPDQSRPDYAPAHQRRLPDELTPAGQRRSAEWETGDSAQWDEPRARGRGPRASGAADSAVAPRPRRRYKQRRLALVIVVAVLCGTIAALGVLAWPHLQGTLQKVRSPLGNTGASATYTPGPTPTTHPNFTLYQSDHAHYSMSMPTGWNVQSTTTTVQGQPDYLDSYAAAGSVSQVTVERIAAFATASDQQLIDGEVAAASAPHVSFASLASPQATQPIGGQTWQRKDYIVTTSGTAQHMVVFACHRAGQSYVIVLVSAAAGFAHDDQTVYTPMLSTFRFDA